MAHTHEGRIDRTRLTGETPRRLLSLETDGHSVLSLYLNLDPSHLPNLRERHMEASSLLAEAERSHEQRDWGSHEERMAAREDIERVRALFADESELAVEGARGLAVFCCAGAGILEVVSLPEPLRPRVAHERRMFVEPLLEELTGVRWCVLLVSRRASRLLRGDRDGLNETAEALDDVHRHHAQGGWSQSRYQRGVEKEADDHIRAACQMLFEQLQKRPFGRLAVGGPQELHHHVRERLHPDLQARLAGFFEVDVERAPVEEVRHRLAPLVEDDERAREEQALARLREGAAPTGHAAAGLDEVLELLNERRVQTLLIPHDLSLPGFACPRCGRLGTEEVACPLDGGQPVPREDVLESAIAAALAQDAEVMFVRHAPEQLGGSIAALLRY